MDARRILLAWTAFSLLTVSVSLGQQMYSAESNNFSVVAPDPRLAAETARLAEQFRKQLAEQWLGHELPTWQERCPIRVEISPHAGGETTFAFNGPPGTAEPSGWRMRIFGPPERILDAVLPHEVTHTIFATHFGQPLPRWADEGACTTVEHVSEREKIQKLLIEYLTARPSRGLPFNRMFTMKQYPDNPAGMLPLYAQSYSVARYLIMQRGHQHFVSFVQRGLDEEKNQNPLRAWDRAISEFYGYEDLSDFQLTWQAWVAGGSRDASPAVVAALPNSQSSAPVIAAAYTTTDGNGTVTQNGAPQFAGQDAGLSPIDTLPADSWYRQQLSRPVATDPVSNHSLRRIDSTLPAGASGGLPRETSRGTIWR